MEKVQLNRLKIVLAENNRTNRWLADQLGFNENTVSRWSQNHKQPALETLYQVSLLLDCDLKDLIASTKAK